MYVGVSWMAMKCAVVVMVKREDGRERVDTWAKEISFEPTNNENLYLTTPSVVTCHYCLDLPSFPVHAYANRWGWGLRDNKFFPPLDTLFSGLYRTFSCFFTFLQRLFTLLSLLTTHPNRAIMSINHTHTQEDNAEKNSLILTAAAKGAGLALVTAGLVAFTGARYSHTYQTLTRPMKTFLLGSGTQPLAS